MPKIDRIDPDAPVASLLEATGLSQSELARRMGVVQPAVAAAIKRGNGVTVEWLTRAVGAAGQELDLRLKKK